MRQLGTMLAPLLLAACASGPAATSLDYDPLEPQNREAHAFNKEVDRTVYGPVARGYGGAVPQPVRQGVSNLRDNWRLPVQVIQYGLQGRGVDAAKSTTRFAVNTVFGLGGVLDVAGDMGLPYDETDFDEVFYRWGIPEGGYWELPYIGPGTQRDWTGYAFDQLLDPTYYLLPGAGVTALFVLGGLDIVNDRYELDTTLDTLLYDSEDSYSAQRIAYLQNMRARLRGGTDIDELEDIYADQ
jgi:phospholipid-binding lipoprotein MlaA